MLRKFIFVFMFLAFSACSFTGISGNGKIGVKKFSSLNLENINGIVASGSFDIYVNISDTPSLKVITDENLLPLVKVRISGDKLKIKPSRNLSPTNDIRVEISLPHLTYIDLSGANDLTVTGLNEQELYVDCSGASSLNLNGRVGKFTADASGSSELNAFGLKADEIFLDASGATDAEVYALELLRISASGVADIEYIGEPELINTDISGAASINKYYDKNK